MGRKPKEVHEYERKCSRCGAIRYVSEAFHDERPPSRLEITGTKMQILGNKLTPFIGWLFVRRSERQLEQLRERERRITERDSCASCGSASFTEVQMWETPPSKAARLLRWLWRLMGWLWRMANDAASFLVAEIRRRRAR